MSNKKNEDKIKDFSDLLDSLENTEDKKKLLWKEAYQNAVEDRESASILVNDLLVQIPGSSAKEQAREDQINPSSIFDSIEG